MTTTVYNYEPQTLALTACCLLAGYLSYRCWTPPNPPPATPYSKDRVGSWIIGQSSLDTRRSISILTWLYHTLLTLNFPHPPALICPQAQNLSPSIFTWNTYTIVCLSLILTAAPIRLLAFAQLGQNFTFRLAKPKGLVKTGLYAYVQHPSYSTTLAVFLTGVALLLRVDGMVGCWLPSWVVQWRGMGVVGVVVMVVLSGFACWGLSIRVRDEEEMLRKECGREWEVYHQKTARFVPWLF